MWVAYDTIVKLTHPLVANHSPIKVPSIIPVHRVSIDILQLSICLVLHLVCQIQLLLFVLGTCGLFALMYLIVAGACRVLLCAIPLPVLLWWCCCIWCLLLRTRLLHFWWRGIFSACSVVDAVAAR